MKEIDKLDKLLRYQELVDIYRNLLTERHQEIVQLVFFEDLGFSEVAEILDISRQAVYDSIKQAIKNLENYERSLNLLEKKKELASKIYLIKQEIDKEISDSVNLKELITDIESIL